MSNVSASRFARLTIVLTALAVTVAPAPAGALVATAPPGGAVAAEAAGPVSTAATGARCVGQAFDDTPAFQAAIDTGHTVYAPALGGQCHITRPLVMKTPGQIIHGDGRARTRIAIEPGFTGDGVFVAKTGEPGPVWRDFSISFAQPDTDDRAKLVRYPPAFFVPDTPRFAMDHLGCYVATTCIDMKGNSGGATISDLQFDAFEVGIDIDGSLDTVRVIDPHWWPVSLSLKQQKIFLDQGSHRAVALELRRVDDFVLRGGLFFGGLALRARSSKGGASNANIDGTDFDSYSGLVMEDGALQISASNFTLVSPNARAIDQTGGSLTIGTSFFFVGTNLNMPVVETRGGSLTITGSRFTSLAFDVTALRQAGASTVMLEANRFERAPNENYRMPTLDFRAGRTTAIGNYSTDKGNGAGVFINFGNDNPFNRVIGNTSPGWPNYVPSTHKGIYTLN